MPCRVGMTIDPELRKREWETEHPDLHNWRILSTHPTKTAAQQAEHQKAHLRGCVSHAGGVGPERALWSVYYFEYDS